MEARTLKLYFLAHHLQFLVIRAIQAVWQCAFSQFNGSSIAGKARSDDITSRIYVDGALVSKKATNIANPPQFTHALVSGSSYDANAHRTGCKQKMRFAPIAARDSDAPAVVDMGAPLPQSQAGRIDVVVYRQIGPAVHKTANISRHAGSMTTAGRGLRWQEKYLWHGRGL